MVSLRPHILTFISPGTPDTEDPDTGYTIPGIPGGTVQIPCRFVANVQKQFRNEDSTTVQQKGRIRVDVGSVMPKMWQEVVVTEDTRELFRGQAMVIYTGGHLTGWRIDV